MQNDARKRVHHRRERRNRKNVARYFNRALLRLLRDFLHALRMRHVAHVPDIAENSPRVWLEQRGKLAIVIPGARDGAFIDGPRIRTEARPPRRNVRLRAIESHVALALLLGVVERMRVEKRPHELPADIFEAEFEVSVLVNRVMAAVERRSADIHALLFSDLLGADQPRRIARPCGGNRGVERMRGCVAQRDTRLGGFDERFWKCAGRCGYGCRHGCPAFYTAAQLRSASSV